MLKLIQDHPLEFWTLVVSGLAVAASTVALFQARMANGASDRANRTSEQTLRHQIINDLYREYRQMDMANSVRAMWALNRKHKPDPELVREAYSIEQEKEHEEERVGELYGHRRKVTQFYVQLAVEATYDPIFRDVLYSLWFKADLSIIPLVLLPVDELIVRKKGAMPGLADMDVQNRRLYDLWDKAHNP
jgi:hypothetical protein